MSSLFFYTKHVGDTYVRPQDEPNQLLRFIKKCFVGGMTGVVSFSGGIPFDTINTFVQTSEHKIKV